MAIDDNQAKTEAVKLEKMLEKGDTTSLHNRLLNDSKVVDKDSFNKVMNSFNDLNKEARKQDPNLPSLEIHNDFFGMGTTDQIVLHNPDGKKMEIFESAKHRQEEKDKMNQQSNPNEMDLGRNMSKFAANEWVGSRTDFHTDSSVPWQQEGQNSSPDHTVVDHRNGNVVGAFDYGQNTKRVNSEQELQQILNNPPAGFGGAYRRN